MISRIEAPALISYSPAFSVQRDWFKWCIISVLSVIVLWVVVKVLFVLAGS